MADRCDDCGSTVRVRFYPDAECRGVHSCHLCDRCTGRGGQRQDSLNDQLNDLARLAVEHGMYDAADWMRSIRARSRTGTLTQVESREIQQREDGPLVPASDGGAS